MDIDGKLLRSQEDYEERPLKSGLYVKSTAERWPSFSGIVDASGKEVIPMKYNFIADDGELIICQIYSYENPRVPVMDIYDKTGRLLYHGVNCMFLPFFVG